jgi:hypothetical protein
MVAPRPGYITYEPKTHVSPTFREERICEVCGQRYMARSKVQRFCRRQCQDRLRVRGDMVEPSDERDDRLATLDRLISTGAGEEMTAEGRRILARLRRREYARH